MVITGLTYNHTFVCGSSQRSLQSSRTPEAQWATSFVSQLVRIGAKSVLWVMGCLKQPLTWTTSQHQPSGYRSISLHLVLAVVCHGLRAFFFLGEYKAGACRNITTGSGFASCSVLAYVVLPWVSNAHAGGKGRGRKMCSNPSPRPTKPPSAGSKQ